MVVLPAGCTMCQDWVNGCAVYMLYYLPGLGEWLYSLLVVLCARTG